MFPHLAGADYEYTLSLPPSERCKHLGAMVVHSTAMTEFDNGQDAFADLNPLLTPSPSPVSASTCKFFPHPFGTDTGSISYQGDVDMGVPKQDILVGGRTRSPSLLAGECDVAHF